MVIMNFTYFSLKTYCASRAGSLFDFYPQRESRGSKSDNQLEKLLPGFTLVLRCAPLCYSTPHALYRNLTFPDSGRLHPGRGVRPSDDHRHALPRRRRLPLPQVLLCLSVSGKALETCLWRFRHVLAAF